MVRQAALDVAGILEERSRLAEQLGEVLPWDKHCLRLAGQAATPLYSTLDSTAGSSQHVPACTAHAFASPSSGAGPQVASAARNAERTAQAARCTRPGADPAPNPSPVQGGGAAGATARMAAAAASVLEPGAGGAAGTPASAAAASATASLGLHAASLPALIQDSEDVHAGAAQPLFAATAPAAAANAPQCAPAAAAAPLTAEVHPVASGPEGGRPPDPNPYFEVANSGGNGYSLRLTLDEPTQAERDGDGPMPGGQAAPAVRAGAPEHSPVGDQAAASSLQAPAAEPGLSAAAGAAPAGPAGDAGAETAPEARAEPGGAKPCEPGSTVERGSGLGRGSQAPCKLRNATGGGDGHSGEPDLAAGPGPACAEAGAARAVVAAVAAAAECDAAAGQKMGGAAGARAASHAGGGLGCSGADAAGNELQVEPGTRGASAERPAGGAVGQAGQAGVGCSLQDGLGAWWAGGWSPNPAGSVRPEAALQEPTAGPQETPPSCAGATMSPAPRGAARGGSPDPGGHPASSPREAGAGAPRSDDATPSWLVTPGASGAGQEVPCSTDRSARAVCAAALAPAPMQAYPADRLGPSAAAGAPTADADACASSPPPPSLDPLCSFVPATALTDARHGAGRERSGGPRRGGQGGPEHGGEGGPEHGDVGALGRAADARPCTSSPAGGSPAAEASSARMGATAMASPPAGETGPAAAANAAGARRESGAGVMRRRGVIAAQSPLPTGCRAAAPRHTCAAADPPGSATGFTLAMARELRRSALLGDGTTQTEYSPMLNPSTRYPACYPGPAAANGLAEGMGSGAGWVRKRRRADADSACASPLAAGDGKRHRAAGLGNRAVEDCQNTGPGGARSSEPWCVAARTRRAAQDAAARQASAAAPWLSRLRRCPYAWGLDPIKSDCPLGAEVGRTRCSCVADVIVHQHNHLFPAILQNMSFA